MPRVKNNKRGADGAPVAGLRVNANKMMLNAESRQKLSVMESALLARKHWSDLLGQTFGGDRDIYDEMGWKKQPTFNDYKRRFERQDIAHTIVSAYPDATWREEPTVREDDSDAESEFEKAFLKHAESVKLWHYLRRLDIMAGVGRYAAMLLGLKGASSQGALTVEPAGTSELIYLQPFYEADAEIKEWDKQVNSERYGLPELYKLTTRIGTPSDDRKTGDSMEVHALRLLHVAEGCLESDVFGTSRLQRVFNRLEDLEKILGASAEGFWKKAFPGAAFIKDPEADWGDSEADMEDEIEEYYHKFTRWMRLSGVDVHEFQGKADNPKFHFDVQIAVLSAASRIPARILTGSERGELASSQDEGNWLSRVDERRKNFAGPVILRPYVERMIEFGVLPEPKQFEIVWPDVDALSEKDQAEIATKKASAAKDYANGMVNGLDLVIPPYFFLVDFLNVDEARAEEYAKAGEEIEVKAAEEAEEAARVEREEADRVRRKEGTLSREE